MTSHVDVEALIERHKRFWTRGEDSFLRTAGVFLPSLPIGLPQPDGSVITHTEQLTPDMIHPDILIDEVEARLDLGPADLITGGKYLVSPGIGDQLPRSQPLVKIPWIEAMLGCPHHDDRGAYLERALCRRSDGTLGTWFAPRRESLVRAVSGIPARVAGASRGAFPSDGQHALSGAERPGGCPDGCAGSMHGLARRSEGVGAPDALLHRRGADRGRGRQQGAEAVSRWVPLCMEHLVAGGGGADAGGPIDAPVGADVRGADSSVRP